MSRRLQIAMLPDGRRLHLNDGPIDLVVEAHGEAAAVRAAYEAAAQRLEGLLDALCAELPLLRSQATADQIPVDAVARRMHAAVLPFATEQFITPMAAVAGAVAEAILVAMVRAARLDRAYVNNGGDIAVHCTRGHAFVTGLIDRPDRPTLFGRVAIDARSPVRGIATSGWRGRSFSLGIADSVTVLARSAAEADAAATVIANAVDLPGHPAVRRCPATAIQADSDLGERLVTRDVGPLSALDQSLALAAGCRCGEQLLARGLILGAALHLQGMTRVIGDGVMSLVAAEQKTPGCLPAISSRQKSEPVSRNTIHA